MKTHSHGFDLLHHLVFVLLLMGLAGHAIAAKTYIDNGNGTVTDPTTRLVWMRCAMGQTLDNFGCSGTAKTYTFAQANALIGTVTFAGYSDWRLPNIRELQTIVDRLVFDPAIDSVAFPNTPSSYFWSASVAAGFSDYAWVVRFLNGYTEGNSKSDTYQVRLVRAGQSFGLLDSNRPDVDYVDHGDGTVTHTPTGLMWQQCVAGETRNGSTCVGTASDLTWSDALQLNSKLAGYTDWRLPTEDELLSLVDYMKLNPAINTNMFPTAPNSVFWSASAYSGNSEDAWNVHFSHGSADYRDYRYQSNTGQARLVRNAQIQSTGWSLYDGVTPGDTITLSIGWNLLGNGWNKLLFAAELFGDKTKVNTVWKWDRTASGWQFYTPTMTAQDLQDYANSKGYGVLGEISAGEGFWVNVKQSFTVVLPTTVPITGNDFQAGKAYALRAGWNLVAVGKAQSAGNFNRDLSTTPPIAGEVPLNLTTLWAWDNPQTKWFFYAPNLEAKDGGKTLTDYIASKGYLDFTTANKLLGPGTGFWVNKP